MSQTYSEQLDAEALRRKLSDLEKKRSELAQLGFLEPEQAPGVAPTPVLERKRDVLSVYVSDVEKKLDVFDELAAKILLLTRIINGRFRFKHLQLHRERGLVFTSATGNPLSRPISRPASSMSSSYSMSSCSSSRTRR